MLLAGGVGVQRDGGAGGLANGAGGQISESEINVGVAGKLVRVLDGVNGRIGIVFVERYLP